ncbi:hypothetical protein DY000_02015360 [Brassica cretica]|uniref:DUF1985 domain-containing protein n=1 Tax=Brassica cretica TaxID=69181 RepID=A0ABQ7CP00_BRACR|nr:hypothetical protein DY000_02015360 [Brassica cretica]
MMKALKDISKNHKKSTSTRAPVAEPSLFINEKPKELTVLQPEHPSSLVLSQQVFEEEPLDYPHQGPHLDTRNPSDEDLGPIFDEEDEPGPVFDEEATSITSIVMESHLCFDPGTIPTPLSPDLQEHCENLDLINSLSDMFVKISSHDVIRFGHNKALITGDLFASSYALNEILIKMLLESKSLRTETDFCDLVLKSDLLSSENDKTWHLLRSFRNICVILNYVEKDMHVLRIIDIVACLDTILVYNVYFDVHLGRLKFSVLSVQERQVRSQRNESIALVHQPEIWSFMNLRNGAVHGYRRDDPMSSQQLDDWFRLFSTLLAVEESYKESTYTIPFLRSEAVSQNPTIYPNQKHCKDHGLIVSAHLENKQRNQRKRQNRFDDDEKRVRSGDCPFTKAKRSNRDVFEHNEFQTYVRSSDHTDQTDRAVPRASRLELRLEPRPDVRTDRTGSRLPRPTRHSKTHGRARLSLGREETEDGHAFSSGGPSGQSRKRPYLYPVHPSGSDEPGHYLKGHL